MDRATERSFRTHRPGAGVLLCALACLAAGCVVEHQATLEREPQTQAERNFRDLWRAGRKVLKQYDFPIDREDRRDGVMTTYAVSGGHLLEALWRKDASSFFTFQENTAQNILRAARITVRRRPGSKEEFDFTVEVLMARTDRVQPQMTDSAETERVRVRPMPTLRFDDLRPRDSMTPEERRGLRGAVVPLGRDESLERRIAQDIAVAAGVFYDTFAPMEESPPRE